MRGWSSGNTMGKLNIVNPIAGSIVLGCQMIQLELGYIYQKVISTPFVFLIYQLLCMGALKFLSLPRLI